MYLIMSNQKSIYLLHHNQMWSFATFASFDDPVKWITKAFDDHSSLTYHIDIRIDPGDRCIGQTWSNFDFEQRHHVEVCNENSVDHRRSSNHHADHREHPIPLRTTHLEEWNKARGVLPNVQHTRSEWSGSDIFDGAMTILRERHSIIDLVLLCDAIVSRAISLQA